MSDEEHPLQDFRNWLWLCWKHLGLPEPTPVQYDIAQYLQNSPRRCIIMAFRGVGKSFITAAYVTWRLFLNPQLKFLVVSASKDRADSFSLFVKRLIMEMDELRHLRPRDDQRFSNIAFDVGPAINDQSPSVKSVGITGQLTGSRADIIIADDVEVPKNSATQDQRTKLSELVKEFDAVLKPGGQIKYLGTPQTEFSLYAELEQRGYECRIWPARVPDEKRVEFYGRRMAPYVGVKLMDGAKVGASLDPKRFSDLDLAEREASYGRSGFALQFMLDTSLSDADRYPLRLSDLAVTSLDLVVAPARIAWGRGPDLTLPHLMNVGFNGDRYYRPIEMLAPWTEYDGAVMAIDPSGRGKDETAYAVVKFKAGTLYLTASGGFKDGFGDETMRGLAEVAKRQKVKHVLVEDNFGGGMFSKLLSPWLIKVGYPVTIEDTRAMGQKETRIIGVLEPVMNQHLLVVDEDVVKKDYSPDQSDLQHSLFYQMTRITKERGALAHDDRLDALANAVSYWVDQMGIDADRAAMDAQEALLDAELAAFAEGVLGRGKSELTWSTPRSRALGR